MCECDLLIVYASETGTAQDIAECVWRSGVRRRGVRARLACASELDISSLVESVCAPTGVCLFVVSTCGRGELPTTMCRSLWPALCRRALSTDLFATGAGAFALLGIGDSQYEHFNFGVKKLHRRLQQLGAHFVMDVGLCDEQHDLGKRPVGGVLAPSCSGVDGMAQPFVDELWTHIGAAAETIDSIHVPPKYVVQFIDTAGDNVHAVATPVVPDDDDGTRIVPLVSCTRVTPDDHFQDTRLIEFDISLAGWPEYRPGDVAHVQPCNLDETVRMFVDAIDASADQLLRRVRISPGVCHTLPPSYVLDTECTTMMNVIERMFDLQSVPRRSLLQQLADYATDKLQRDKLRELCAGENREDLYNYINRPRRTIAETLMDFAQTARAVPLFRWFDLLPAIRPRAFSIASCSRVHIHRLQLLVAVVEYRSSVLKIARRGLCSTFLTRAPVGVTCVAVRLSRGTLPLPPSSAPCILVGPGTGVAPLRALCHWRYGEHTKTTVSTLLFYGGRSARADFYFEHDYIPMTDNGVTVITAFSRDQAQKIYVQHRIGENAHAVSAMLSRDDCHVWVCGAADRMPADVRAALTATLVSDGGMSEEGAHKHLATMDAHKRYSVEVWS